MKGYQALPKLLHRAGLGAVFAMLGGTNVPWVAQGVDDGTLALVKTRHEETSVNAACGFSRSTGEVALCSVTRGPGFANAVNALTAATRLHVPILLIVGESPTRETLTPQIIDQRTITRAIGAGFHHVATPDELERTFWRALRATRWESRPQVLSIGEGLLSSLIPLLDDGGEQTSLRPDAVPSTAAVSSAVDTILSGSRPLVLAGWGAVLDDCRTELEELASLLGAPLATSMSANRFFSGHRSDLGLSGGWAPPVVYDHLAEIDTVIGFGASFNPFTTSQGDLYRDAEVVLCGLHPDGAGDGRAVAHRLMGTARSTAKAMIQELKRRGANGRAREFTAPERADIRASLMTAHIGPTPAGELDPRDVYSTLDDLLPEDRIVVTDTGRFLGTLPSLVDAPDAKSFLVCNGFGSIGVGLGTAVGAAAAHPDRPVVLFCGDGSFMMASHDVDAIHMNQLHLTVFIMNDRMYGSDAKYLAAHGLPDGIIRQGLPDIPTFARAFGGRGHVVTSTDELSSLDLTHRGLTLIDVRVDGTLNAIRAYA